MPIHPRNERYKNQLLSAPYEICIERARYYTQSYRQTEGQHPALRAAQAFDHALRHMTLGILEEERILGNRTSKLLAAPISVERGDANVILEMELDNLTRRELQPYRISPEDRDELLSDILPYWRDKTLRHHKKNLWKANGLAMKPSLFSRRLLRHLRQIDLTKIQSGASIPKMRLPQYVFRGIKELIYNNPAFVMNAFDVQGHLILGHNNILREGFAGVKAKALEGMQSLDPYDSQGQAFLQSVVLACDAIQGFASRLADRAEELAKRTAQPVRRAELLASAERCRRVPYHPPRDFLEALQAIWLTQVGAIVAYGMAGIFAVGRIDQLLYPFYAADQEAGRITEVQAVEWIEELMIKLSTNLLMIPMIGKETGSELGADSCCFTVGGVDSHGNDAVNALSFLFLEAFENVLSMGNSFAVRLSEKSSEAFWNHALGTYRKTSGAALFHDEMVVQALQGCGYGLSDARDYGIIGCVEPTSAGNTFGCTSGNDISFTAGVEMALLNGHLRLMGRKIGPRTGDPRNFTRFDEFMDAFKQQISFMIRTVVKAANLKDQAYMEHYPNPYVSATLSGCVENVKDMTAGGAEHNFGSVSARGLGTAVDSLAAVKHFVYKKRVLPMDRLIEALDSNFRGAEDLRNMLANEGPKYGSDDDRADHIAQEIVAHFCEEVASHSTIRGGPFRPGFFSYGMHVLEGIFLGATPNGRRAGEPVSNSFSPSNGCELNGPTAMLRSVAKINHRLISNGCAVNLKLLPSLFEGDEQLSKIVSLVKGFFSLGGMEIQPNAVSTETLRAAQKQPDEYRDLVVRVSGYSAFFCDLGRSLQDEIIQRTEFGDLGKSI